jgi:type II secretory pathway pseudopilin PulG
MTKPIKRASRRVLQKVMRIPILTRPIKSRSAAKSGFTIIELMLAMTFLATLLVVIAVLVIRIVSIYQKGLAIRAINSTGRALIDDFTRTVGGSPIVNVSFATGETGLTKVKDYFFENTAPATPDPDNPTLTRSGAQMSGGFCTGSFSYLWNTAYASGTDRISYNDDSNFRLLKIPDPERQICAQHLTPKNSSKVDPISYTCGSHNFNFILPIQTDDGRYTGTPNTNKTFYPPRDQCDPPIELLANSGDKLILYDFRVFPAAANQITGHIFYNATFILATQQGGVDIFATGDYCSAVPDNLNTDFNYCAINKFNFAMRATGETTNEEEETYGERKEG